MAYKGVLPSDLWDRYDCEGGQEKLLLDMGVASEIQDKISEATKDAKKKRDGNSMAARRKQKQSQRQLLNNNEGLDLFRSLGIPLEKK
tara:strand:+ start:206 stop:469 length:264 start_codon:yes stop_codon:yes gene_type:complete